MKIRMKLAFSSIFVLLLAGCFGEDYDVGVPSAHLYKDVTDFPLSAANISWKTASEDVQKTGVDVEEEGRLLARIKVLAGDEATLEFKENVENGGDIWTDPKITAVLVNGDEKIELQLSDERALKFPTVKGKFILVVEFISAAGSAQYLGNIVIE